MLKSMTGFAFEKIDSNEGNFSIEISTVNKRFLDIVIYFPKEFSIFEKELKRIITDKISRGQVIVKINFSPNNENVDYFLPDRELMLNLKNKWEDLARFLSLDKKQIDMNFLNMQMKNISPNKLTTKIDGIKETLIEGLEKTLDSLNDMRVNEGSFLFDDISKRLDIIEMHVKKVEKLSTQAKEKHFEKLKNNLMLLLNSFEDINKDERVFKEMAILSEKMDVSEEITRLYSHIAYFKTLLSSEKQVGRKLDFLLQELNREANTLASKAYSDDISKIIIEVKSEIEKIKEQIQNIE